MKLLLLITISSVTIGIHACRLRRHGAVTNKDETIHFQEDDESQTFDAINRDIMKQKHQQAKPITDDIKVESTHKKPVQYPNSYEPNANSNNDYRDVQQQTYQYAQKPDNNLNYEFSPQNNQGQNYPTGYYPTDRNPTTKYPTDYYPATNYQTANYPAAYYPAAQTTGYPGAYYPAAQTTNYPTANYPAAFYPADQTNTGRGDNQGSRTKDQGFNVSAAIGDFGIKMLQYTSPQTNLVMSPFSIATLLALLQQGAYGETQLQISNALGMQPDVAVRLYRILTEIITNRQSQHNILTSANSIFVSEYYSLNRNFTQTASQYFGSEITSLNFYDSPRAASTINGWVARKTKNNIKEIVSPDSLNENTQLVLANAMYFKGVWQLKFRNETTLPRDFYGNNKQRKTIPFLRTRRNFRCGVDEETNAQVVILPFENLEYSFMAILPSSKSSVADLLPKLSYQKLASFHNFTPQDVELEIPKFSIRSDTDLEPLLGKLGVTNMFRPGSELSGISSNRNSAPSVSSAIHTAMFSIDEEGGTAAAATTFTVVALSYDSPDVVFKADKPFIAVVWDTKLAIPLFMAKVEDPTF